MNKNMNSSFVVFSLCLFFISNSAFAAGFFAPSFTLHGQLVDYDCNPISGTTIRTHGSYSYVWGLGAVSFTRSEDVTDDNGYFRVKPKGRDIDVGVVAGPYGNDIVSKRQFDYNYRFQGRESVYQLQELNDRNNLLVLYDETRPKDQGIRITNASRIIQELSSEKDNYHEIQTPFLKLDLFVKLVRKDGGLAWRLTIRPSDNGGILREANKEFPNRLPLTGYEDEYSFDLNENDANKDPKIHKLIYKAYNNRGRYADESAVYGTVTMRVAVLPWEKARMTFTAHKSFKELNILDTVIFSDGLFFDTKEVSSEQLFFPPKKCGGIMSESPSGIDQRIPKYNTDISESVKINGQGLRRNFALKPMLEKASDSNTTLEWLSNPDNTSEPRVAMVALKNPNITPEIIESIYIEYKDKVKGKGNKRQILSNLLHTIAYTPKTPEFVLREMFERETYRRSLTRNTKLPNDLMLKIINAVEARNNGRGTGIYKVIASNTGISAEVFQILLDYAQVNDVLAENSSTPEYILRELDNISDIELRKKLATNNNLPIDILQKYANEGIEVVVKPYAGSSVNNSSSLQENSDQRDILNYIGKNKSTPSPLLERLSIVVPWAVAVNPYTPPELLRTIYKKKKFGSALARNPSTPLDVIEELANEYPGSVRCNPSVPDDMRQKLKPKHKIFKSCD